MASFVDRKIPFLPSKKNILLYVIMSLACGIYLWFAVFAPKPLVSFDPERFGVERKWMCLAALAGVGLPFFAMFALVNAWWRLNPRTYIYLRSDHVLFPAFGIRFRPTRIEYSAIAEVAIDRNAVPILVVYHAEGRYECGIDLLGNADEQKKFVSELRLRSGLD